MLNFRLERPAQRLSKETAVLNSMLLISITVTQCHQIYEKMVARATIQAQGYNAIADAQLFGYLACGQVVDTRLSNQKVGVPRHGLAGPRLAGRKASTYCT
ncbi:hypothetical protein ElyMa_001460400 [Elysia marginata]|uniref:Uncharacterized protein n=1 Tax=Elysia marginata TaxID=1093978 RepID=A0AAV4J3T0_9GAST|nr:hypothetical protein ElyMa_001460400 [Elysia marginata]